MSKRRQPGETVIIDGNRCVLGDDGPDWPFCIYECGDDDCQEWTCYPMEHAGVFERHFHENECRMGDPT